MRSWNDTIPKKMQCNADHVQRHNTILVDLGDAIAPELELPFDRISLEMVEPY
ncbi:hypothetical protein [Nostoc sp.]|uniref:hypothetical protein n=1 Tax=Nostoc sp. TaxID=1180 RepID=UPI002FF55387